VSYARWVNGCEVYVYRSPAHKYHCCGCPRLVDVDVVLGSPGEMAEHLEQDRAAGFSVPQNAIDRLRAEARA
jgi:hypothetical protein